jgi:lipoprotein-anchoring transpeptidase ErfK/SrfK
MSKVDYFPILYRAVAALNPNEPHSRAGLYNKARKMLAEREGDSALENVQISEELLALESAIRRIEAEFAAADQAPKQVEAVRPELLRSYPEPEPQASIDLSSGPRWPWKTIAAIAAAVALIWGGTVLYPWTKRQPQQAQTAPQAERNADAGVPLEAVQKVDFRGADQRPYTLRRQLVYYRTTLPPGVVVISKSQKFLYLVRPNISAMRYSISLGRKCAEAAGLYHVSDKAEFPGWDDAQPDGQTESVSTLITRTANPLGARAIYLETDDRSIHGVSRAIAPGSSLACFQLLNEDVIDLFDRVAVGTRVVAAN